MGEYLIEPEPARRLVAILTTLKERRGDANETVIALMDDLSDHELKTMIISMGGLWASAVEIMIMSDPSAPPDAMDKVIQSLGVTLHDGLRKDD